MGHMRPAVMTREAFLRNYGLFYKLLPAVLAVAFALVILWLRSVHV